MDAKELQREIEQAEYLARHLSAHAALFDNCYNDVYGLEQASLDPDCFFTSWNEIFGKVDELYGFVKSIVEKMYEKGGDYA